MVETYVGSYAGCEMYIYRGEPGVPEEWYGSNCVPGYFPTKDALKDAIWALQYTPLSHVSPGDHLITESLIVYREGGEGYGDTRGAVVIETTWGYIRRPIGIALDWEVEQRHSVLLGTAGANPFTGTYFPEVYWDYDTLKFVSSIGGVAPDGHSVTAHKVRADGTVKVMIAGFTEEDTYQACLAWRETGGLATLIPGEPDPPPPIDPLIKFYCEIPIYLDMATNLYYFIYEGEKDEDWDRVYDIEMYIVNVIQPPGCDVMPDPPTPDPPTNGETADQVSYQNKLIEMYARTGGMGNDPGRATKITDALKSMLETIGLTPEAMEAVKASPMNRELAAQMATGISSAAQVGLGLLYSVGILTEVASLGQIETVVDAIDGMLKSTGVDEVLKPLFTAPFVPSIMTPTFQYWRSKFPSEIPESMDLIRFVVREVITPEDFNKWMLYHGFDESWSDAYWEAHWRLPSISDVVDAFHRGLITAEERDKYIVWHDYKPDSRPGITVSDLDIYTGLQKTLIGRVDIRRGFRMGRVSREELQAWYGKLGYEEDSELMADIQAEAALAGQKSPIARAAGRAFREYKIGEGDYRNVLTQLGMVLEVQDLWVRRYQWERIAGDVTAEELQGTLEDLGFTLEEQA